MVKRIKKIMKPEILTVSGNYFNFEDPDNSTYTIEDIAHALSFICRFNGHTKKFYSVAQHCWMVSHLVPADLAMEGLMHDAGEAFLGDVSSPLKQLIPDYKRIELFIEESLCKRFNLLFPFPPEIKHADLIMLASEMNSLMKEIGNKNDILKGISPIKAEIRPWSSKKAARMFVERYYELKELRNDPI